MSKKLTTITRKLEFDAGHRLPGHRGLCRNVHGHHYVIEITLSGELTQAQEASDHGMVVDFGQVKLLAAQFLIDEWDHAFFVYREDTLLREFLEKLPGHDKTIILDMPPTVEKLADLAFTKLSNAYASHYGEALQLLRVRLYETPNCWAQVDAEK